MKKYATLFNEKGNKRAGGPEDQAIPTSMPHGHQFKPWLLPPFAIQIPANIPGKAMKAAQYLGTYTHMGDLALGA